MHNALQILAIRNFLCRNQFDILSGNRTESKGGLSAKMNDSKNFIAHKTEP
jgi:hypothetical protein